MELRLSSNIGNFLYSSKPLKPGDFACKHLTPPAVLANVYLDRYKTPNTATFAGLNTDDKISDTIINIFVSTTCTVFIFYEGVLYGSAYNSPESVKTCRWDCVLRGYDPMDGLRVLWRFRRGHSPAP